MMRYLIKAGVCVASLCLAMIASEAQAAFNSSFGFNGLSTNTDSGDLANAKMTSNTYFSTNGTGTGVFAGLANLPLTSPAYFNPTTGTPGTTAIMLSVPSSPSDASAATTGFNFTNATYGSFRQTQAAILQARSFSSTVPGFVTSVTYYVVGSFSGGVVGSPTDASVTISFTQTAGPGQPLSASGTLTINAMAVPEPASLAMLGLGLAGVGVVARRRSRS